MKIRKLLFIMVSVLLGTTSAFAQCTNCVDSSNVISNNGNGTFSATSAQAYYWEVENCSGSATIVGSNTNQSVTVNCNTPGSVKVKVTRFLNGNCIEACEVYTCPNSNSCGVEVGPPGDLNVEGDDYLVFQAVTDLDAGWTIQSINFQVTFDNGTVVNYTGSILPPNQVKTPAIFVDCPSNPVVSVTVTVTASNGSTTCSDTETSFWRNGVCGTGGGGFSRLSVFPNPTNSKITFEGLDDNKEYSITITNFNGERLISTKRSMGDIDLSQYKPGIYFYTITDQDGNHKTGKIILKE